MQNAAQMGQWMMDCLQEMFEDHPSIGDIRGKGLMIGIELVKDRETKAPAPEIRDEVIQRAFQKGLLILGCGPNTVRFMPALNISQDIAEEGLAIFEAALSEVEEEAGLRG
jgi:4-aminobutyrate aminotransferase